MTYVDKIAKMAEDSGYPEFFAYELAEDVFEQDIINNARVVKSLLNSTHQILVDRAEKAHARGVISKEYLEDTLEVIEKASLNFNVEINGKAKPFNGNPREYNRDSAGRFATVNTLANAIGDTKTGAVPFAQAWQQAGRGSVYGSATSQRLAAGGAALKTIGAASGRPGVTAAGAISEYVGQFGSEAAKAFGPSIKRLQYRYSGTERIPSADLKRAVATEGIDPKQAAQEYLKRRLPSMKLAELQRESGRTAPSEGVMLTKDGKVAHQAVGRADDHYLPFNLKNLKELKGGSYVRTRESGGLTGEDIHVGVAAGAKEVTVVSHSGEFTLKFSPEFVGSDRHTKDARTMTSMYQSLLTTLHGERLDRESVPDGVKGELRAEVESDMPSHLYSPKEIDEAYEAKLKEYKNSPALTKGQVAAIENHVKSDMASRKDAPEEGSEQYKREFAAQKMRHMEQAKEDKLSRKLRLDGDGYATALQALQEQFPYYIEDVTYKTRTKATDESNKNEDGKSKEMNDSDRDLKTGFKGSMTEYRETERNRAKGDPNYKGGQKDAGHLESGQVDIKTKNDPHAYEGDKALGAESSKPETTPQEEKKEKAPTASTGPATTQRLQADAQHKLRQAQVKAIDSLPFGALNAAMKGNTEAATKYPALHALTQDNSPEGINTVLQKHGMDQVHRELEQLRKNTQGIPGNEAGTQALTTAASAIKGLSISSAGYDAAKHTEGASSFSDHAGLEVNHELRADKMKKYAEQAKPLLEHPDVNGDRNAAHEYARNPKQGGLNPDTAKRAAEALARLEHLEAIERVHGGGSPKAQAPSTSGAASDSPSGKLTVVSTPSSKPSEVKNEAQSSTRRSNDNAANTKGTGTGPGSVSEPVRDKIGDALGKYSKEIVGQEDFKNALLEYGKHAAHTRALAEQGYNVKPQDAPIFTIAGPPGTGKTTGAKALGEILHTAGIVDKPDVHVVTAGDLVGSYRGESGKLVNDALEAAKGGVLLVDEAHGLLSHGDYGKAVMSQFAGKIQPGSGMKTAVIFAGYPGKLEEAMALDEGMSRRTTEKFEFKSPTNRDLAEITGIMLKSKLSVPMTMSKDGQTALGRRIANQRASEGAEFGNAGAILKELQAAERRHSVRMQSLPEDQWDTQLDAADFTRTFQVSNGKKPANRGAKTVTTRRLTVKQSNDEDASWLQAMLDDRAPGFKATLVNGALQVSGGKKTDLVDAEDVVAEFKDTFGSHHKVSFK